MLMIRPQRRLFIPGSAARVARNTEVRLIAMTASHRSGGNSSTGATCWIEGFGPGLRRISGALDGIFRNCGLRNPIFAENARMHAMRYRESAADRRCSALAEELP